MKLISEEEGSFNDATNQKRKGKSVEREAGLDCIDKKQDAAPKNCLATLDIFAGCGGLSEGLHQSGNTFFRLPAKFNLFSETPT